MDVFMHIKKDFLRGSLQYRKQCVSSEVSIFHAQIAPHRAQCQKQALCISLHQTNQLLEHFGVNKQSSA